MFILLHVILALSSLSLSAYNVIKPTTSKLKASYGLAVATLFSGVLLVIVNNASVLRTCLTGLLFFATVTAMNAVSAHSLAKSNTNNG